MHCIDNNYVIPAGVAFYSMLTNANRSYDYKLYVLHSDITNENQIKLKETLSEFNNASLEFINMNNKFDDLFEKTKTKGHYSKEMYYKFLAPSIFMEYEKIMVADVDVVYLDDISKNFIDFESGDDFYLAAHMAFSLRGSWLEKFHDGYIKKFSKDEIAKLITGAGYYIFNLRKMRKDNCEEKFINYAKQNLHRLLQPEQDVINLICYPKIKPLPANSMVCTYVFDLYKTSTDFDNDLRYSAEEVKSAINNPVQLHYATNIKPWNSPACTKSEIWFEFLLKTPFWNDFLKQLNRTLNQLRSEKVIFSFDLPLLKRKIILKKIKI